MFQHLKDAVKWYCNKAADNYVWSPLSPKAHESDLDNTDEAK